MMLHFSIDLEWLTDFARQAWSEGRYQYAYDLLESSGCPPEYHDDIIRGRVEMVGTNEGETREDNWKPTLSMCHRGTYPDPDEVAGIAEEGERYKHLYLDRLRADYFGLCRQWDKARNGQELDDLAYLFRQFPQEFVETLEPLERTPWNLSQRYGLATARATAFGGWAEMPNVEQFVKHQLELDARPAPTMDREYASNYGWLLPDGTFYPCEYWEHDWLSSALGHTVAEAESAGWIRIGYSKVLEQVVIARNSDAEIPQDQLDALWDWCLQHGEHLPEWAEEAGE